MINKAPSLRAVEEQIGGELDKILVATPEYKAYYEDALRPLTIMVEIYENLTELLSRGRLI